MIIFVIVGPFGLFKEWNLQNQKKKDQKEGQRRREGRRGQEDQDEDREKIWRI
jgi:ribosomal protein L3